MKKINSKNKKYKILQLIFLMSIVMSFLVGCVGKTDDITVISREDGSGTRGAFIELFGIEQKGDNFRKDRTTKEAMVVKQTDMMMVSVAGDKNAIGYISLSSLNDTIKPVKVDGVSATSANVKNGEYKVSRPFIIATKGDESKIAKDFIDYILSKEGQEIVGESYISVNDKAPEYINHDNSGKVVVAGSSSVTPLMEKLKEGYLKLNPNVKIEIQQSDSSTGLSGAISGTCDIAMSSRDLKEEEIKELKPIKIALDGIAIIVNKENPVTDLSAKQIGNIFMGKITTWKDIDK
ncbi:MAG: extracellular solute-binding protein [Lachnospiraceae bacterium]|nr:extracellular solute-binding protein [Lachnospiraceae bacterium]